MAQATENGPYLQAVQTGLSRKILRILVFLSKTRFRLCLFELLYRCPCMLDTQFQDLSSYQIRCCHASASLAHAHHVFPLAEED